jgi:hypothetical protein
MSVDQISVGQMFVDQKTWSLNGPIEKGDSSSRTNFFCWTNVLKLFSQFKNKLERFSKRLVKPDV